MSPSELKLKDKLYWTNKNTLSILELEIKEIKKTVHESLDKTPTTDYKFYTQNGFEKKEVECYEIGNHYFYSEEQAKQSLCDRIKTIFLKEVS